MFLRGILLFACMARRQSGMTINAMATLPRFAYQLALHTLHMNLVAKTRRHWFPNWLPGLQVITYYFFGPSLVIDIRSPGESARNKNNLIGVTNAFFGYAEFKQALVQQQPQPVDDPQPDSPRPNHPQKSKATPSPPTGYLGQSKNKRPRNKWWHNQFFFTYYNLKFF